MSSRKRSRDSGAGASADAAPAAKGEEPASQTLSARTQQLSSAFSSFAKLWRQGQFCDVEVVLDCGAKFQAHKLVLAAGSDFFHSMFGSGMRDARVKTVRVSEVDAAAMRDVLCFLYDMQLEVRPANLAGIMRVASRLEVTSLLTLSAEFLSETLSIETCLASWGVAISIGRPELDVLQTACARMAASHFTALAAQAEFPSLSFAQLRAVLSSDHLAVREERAFDALTNWLAQRRPPVADAEKLELLSAIRYPFISSEFMAGKVESVLGSVPGGQELLFEAYRHKSMPENLRTQSPRTKPRRACLPRGVQRDLPASFLEAWTCHYEHNYSHETRPSTIEGVPTEATHVFVGARRPDGSIALGAVGRRDDVIKRSAHSRKATEGNGVYWYFAFDDISDDDSACSFGFAPEASIDLRDADVLGTGDYGSERSDDGHYRLSWHLTGSGGWRAGLETDLSDESGGEAEWKKLLYWIKLPGF